MTPNSPSLSIPEGYKTTEDRIFSEIGIAITLNEGWAAPVDYDYASRGWDEKTGYTILTISNILIGGRSEKVTVTIYKESSEIDVVIGEEDLVNSEA